MIALMSRVFIMVGETGAQKMVLDASLLNAQHYKVRIKGKVVQSRVNWRNPGMEMHPPLHLCVVVIEKGAFGSPSTTVVNFTLLLVCNIKQ